LIRSLPLLALLLGPVALAQEAPGDDAASPPVDEGADEPVRTPDDGLQRHREPFQLLADRAIGTTSTPVEFNWRTSTVHLGGTGTLQAELNNFNTLRGGGIVRVPSTSILWEFGLSWSQVWDTPSSRQLAFTPYRQPGRPSRIELDVTAAVPLAEGIVTTAPRWLPAMQLVFNGYLGLRYRLYPTGFAGLKTGQAVGALLSPTLRTEELDNLEKVRPDAMQVDPERYGLIFGLGNDVYLRPGLFVSPRAFFSLPVFAPASQTDLLWWGEATVAVGVAL